MSIMGKGMSLHIGLNYVNPNHYGGWDGKLVACENDARDMEYISRSQGYETKILLRKKATRNYVIKTIEEVSKKLVKGDIFHISFSGHGGRLPDHNNDEEDALDETWCLYDGQLIDDELSVLWKKFNEGVRIFVTSDSCHSGSIIRKINYNTSTKIDSPRYMSNEIALSTYISNQKFYDNLLFGIKNFRSRTIKASVLLISGCQDNQFSYDGPFNGQFTAALKRTWNGGKFNGTYKDFHKRIVKLLPPEQTPNLLTIGKSNLKFQDQQPFTI